MGIIDGGGRHIKNDVKVTQGERKYLDIDKGFAMPVVGDGLIEEPILKSINERFGKDEFFKPVLKELITSIFDERIPRFIANPSYIGSTIGNSWENVSAYRVGEDDYEFSTNLKYKPLGNNIVCGIEHHLRFDSQKHIVRISMKGAQGLSDLEQRIEAEYDPKTLTVKPETVQEHVSFYEWDYLGDA